MSCYALMGYPAPILETMELVIHSYVIVLNIGKRQTLYLYGYNLLFNVIQIPCSLENRLPGIKRYSTYDSMYEPK